MYEIVTLPHIESASMLAAMLPSRAIPLPRLRAVREQALLSQSELANKAGVSKFTVQRIEARQGVVRGVTARKLAKALGVKPAALMASDE